MFSVSKEVSDENKRNWNSQPQTEKSKHGCKGNLKRDKCKQNWIKFCYTKKYKENSEHKYYQIYPLLLRKNAVPR